KAGTLDKAALERLAKQVADALKGRGGNGGPGPGGGGGGGNTGGAPRALVLYDAPTGTPWDKLGFSYAIMLRNLLGHFDAQVDMMPVQQYTAGRLNGYNATFYLGATYDHPIPPAFLA